MLRFTGEDELTIEKHIVSFCAFSENLNVEYLDVVMRLFVQSLDGDARKWFKTLSTNSINSWEELENAFTEKWGGKKDHGYLLIEFNVVKRKTEDDVTKFIKRFNKLYNSLSVEMKPPLAKENLVFAWAFDYEFGFTLRERISPTLDQIQVNAMDIEENISIAGKIKPKEQVEDKGKGK